MKSSESAIHQAFLDDELNLLTFYRTFLYFLLHPELKETKAVQGGHDRGLSSQENR